jgi:hypothetical protein
MTTVSQAEGVCLPTGYGYDLLVNEGLDLHWERLIWLLVRILGQITDVIETKLTVSSFTPSIHMPVP